MQHEEKELIQMSAMFSKKPPNGKPPLRMKSLQGKNRKFARAGFLAGLPSNSGASLICSGWRKLGRLQGLPSVTTCFSYSILVFFKIVLLLYYWEYSLRKPARKEGLTVWGKTGNFLVNKLFLYNRKFCCSPWLGRLCLLASCRLCMVSRASEAILCQLL